MTKLYDDAPMPTTSRLAVDSMPGIQREGDAKRKVVGGATLELRMELIETRRKCADLQNAALEKHGHAVRVDHRTLKEQGIARAPERRLGLARVKKMTETDKQAHVKGRRSKSPMQTDVALAP